MRLIPTIGICLYSLNIGVIIAAKIDGNSNVPQWALTLFVLCYLGLIVSYFQQAWHETWENRTKEEPKP